MKKYHMFKIVQLSILAIFLAVCIMLLLTGSVKQFVFSDTSATILFFVMWAMLLANFIFIFADFHLISLIKLSYHDLYEVAYSDTIGAIPNRFSCDTIIDKYSDADLPDGIGCIMMSISNLQAINQKYGRKAGNQILKDFSGILTNAASSICFVGRNGGNKFMAIFEDCDKDKFQKFLKEVNDRIAKYNETDYKITIEYNAGISLSGTDEVNEITELIALADRRLLK